MLYLLLTYYKVVPIDIYLEIDIKLANQGLALPERKFFFGHV